MATKTTKSKKNKGENYESRQLFTRVKTARGRKSSSTRWLQRQLNDPYVAKARAEGYRSRAAYKLIEMNEKYDFLRPGQCIVDLCAAPGGWAQVAVQLTHADKPDTKKQGTVIGIDLQEVEPITGATMITKDFTEEDAPDILKEALGDKKVDVVLSDMAAASCGHTQTDHIRIIALCEEALYFAYDVLAPGGTFAAKILRGGTESSLLKEMKSHFQTVKHFKPPASRKDSSEMYVVAMGFKSND